MPPRCARPWPVPTWPTRWPQFGLEAASGGPDELAALIRADADEWRSLIRKLQPYLAAGGGDLCESFSARLPVQVFGHWMKLRPDLEAALGRAGPSFIRAVQSGQAETMKQTSGVLYDMARALSMVMGAAVRASAGSAAPRVRHSAAARAWAEPAPGAAGSTNGWPKRLNRGWGRAGRIDGSPAGLS